jgi:type IV pilus assembly protein PilB
VAVKRLGSLLVEEQMITEEQLSKALEEQKGTGEILGETLVRLGSITEEQLYRFLAIQNGLEYGSLAGIEIPPQLVKMIPPAVAWKYKVVPVSQDNGGFNLATSQPDELSLFYLPKELRLPANTKLMITVAPASQVEELLNKHFPLNAGGEIQSADDAAGAIKPEKAVDQDQVDLLAETEQEMLNPDDLEMEILDEEKHENEEAEETDQGPVIKMCEFMIADAVRKRASDIHITPFEKRIMLKYRIDGSLIEFKAPPINSRRRIATRYKIIAGLDIIEKRKPQDGRIHMKVGGRPIDIRIATLPTRWGENIVMRIVDQTNTVLDIAQIGFEGDQLDQFTKAISQPYGMVFVTGPTSSGKTTTLFAALNYVNTPAKNIVTVEDPVEFRLPNVVQIQVDVVAGRTFASVLRAFLRHDPNIMLVGEIRDPETADIAIKASLTGHLVLSSVHTNDAPSTIMRLIDLGIDPVYVGSSVLAVASQRLLRRICDKCREEITIPEEEFRRVGVKPESVAGIKFFKGKGCEACHKTGYKGRLAVFEVLPVSASIREIIFSKGTLNQLKAASREAGFKTIREAAIMKWKAGHTTLDEVLGETFE